MQTFSISPLPQENGTEFPRTRHICSCILVMGDDAKRGHNPLCLCFWCLPQQTSFKMQSVSNRCAHGTHGTHTGTGYRSYTHTRASPTCTRLEESSSTLAWLILFTCLHKHQHTNRTTFGDARYTPRIGRAHVQWFVQHTLARTRTHTSRPISRSVAAHELNTKPKLACGRPANSSSSIKLWLEFVCAPIVVADSG